MKRSYFILFCALALLLAACSTTPTVERKQVDETIDLSGRWNDSDSRLVADEMISDCLERPWLTDYRFKHGGQKPTVIVGRVKNRSHEHINVQTFVKDLERALINSGNVRFVASSEEREQIREERLDMATHSSDETMKGPGQEIGADYMLIGTINTIRDEVSGKAVMFYQTNLELVDLSNNVKVWIGDKKIKKLITQKKVSW